MVKHFISLAGSQNKASFSAKNLSQIEIDCPTAQPIHITTQKRHKVMKNKIVKDTVTILAAFIICWTPYATIHLWYQIDRISAHYLDKNISDILFLFAISNSCVNPYIYGKILPSKCVRK